MHDESGLPGSAESVGPSKSSDSLSIAQFSRCQHCPLAVPTLGAIDLSSAHGVRDAGPVHHRDGEAAVCF